jgi:polyisoprenoid-binding protein YceI
MMTVSASTRLRSALIATFVTTTAVAANALAADAPPPHYALDPAKSTLEFQFVQAGAQNKGKFGKLQTTLDLAPDSPQTGKLDVVVDVNSVDTGDKERDDTLRGADLLSVAKFPQAHFTSTQITKTATGYDAVGKLTLRGVTRDIHIPFSFKTSDAGYLTGKTTIKRLDFGVGQGDWKTTEWVGADVTVTYSLRLVPTGH